MIVNLKGGKWLYPIFALLLFLGIWQLVVSFFSVPSYILPSPGQVGKVFQTSWPELSKNYRITFIESFLGLALGSLIGFVVGIFMAQSAIFRNLTLPVLIASNAVPVIAIAPLILIWFGNTLFAKIMVAAFISFFPLVLNTYRGLSEFPRHYQELFIIYGATRNQFLIKYKLGNALPFIITGLKLNATLSVIGSIIGEFVSSDRGIGFGILQASYNFNTSRLWSYIILACTIGILFYVTFYFLEYFFKNFKINPQ